MNISNKTAACAAVIWFLYQNVVEQYAVSGCTESTASVAWH